MIGSALRDGDPFPPLARAGFILAVAGLVVLVAPGVTAPSPMGALLMAIAGLAWGLYSLMGRGDGNPLEVTVNNFIYLVPGVIVLGAGVRRRPSPVRKGTGPRGGLRIAGLRPGLCGVVCGAKATVGDNGRHRTTVGTGGGGVGGWY